MTQLVKKKVGGESKVKYVSYKTAPVGSVVALGEFVGTEIVPGYKNKGTVPQHKIKTDDGETIILNSAGHLNYLLEKVTPGATVEVIFLGRETSTKFPDGVYKFDVSELVAQ